MKCSILLRKERNSVVRTIKGILQRRMLSPAAPWPYSTTLTGTVPGGYYTLRDYTGVVTYTADAGRDLPGEYWHILVARRGVMMRLSNLWRHTFPLICTLAIFAFLVVLGSRNFVAA